MGLKENVIASFLKVKNDIDQLKSYTVEWVSTIVSTQRKTLQKIRQLEQRLENLENERTRINAKDKGKKKASGQRLEGSPEQIKA